MGTVVRARRVKSKWENLTEAKKLYDFRWFWKSRAYAQARSDTWRILSANGALVGALPPDEVIERYDESLHDFTAARRREWAEGVLEALDGRARDRRATTIPQ